MVEPAATGAFILAIDQGTTSSRTLLFDATGSVRAQAQRELPQSYPQPGWVEHDGEQIWQDCLATAREVIASADAMGASIAALGITNQRETTLLWERGNGRLLHPAIVWQDRRTASRCDALRSEDHGPLVQARTGLLIDPYFSATKLAWLLNNVDGARASARRGELAFGTVDCFLLWRLTGGKVHATDASNAARTMLFDIHRQAWDEDLLRLFDIPASLLPEVRDCSGDFGITDPALFSRAIAIRGMAGDQQAATFGQAAFTPGAVKSTYGTGCFMLANTGSKAVTSTHRLLTTVAWRLKGKVTYALEGSIFMAGATMQWIRDGLRIIEKAADSERLAKSIASTGGVYLVPAFVGLGAPYWDADARGALIGLTRSTGIAEVARAGLEAVCYQSRDLLDAMHADGTPLVTSLRVDGGLCVNDWAMQFLADILDTPVERPVVTETTALGAAYLAGMAAGIYGDMAAIEKLWRRDREFSPAMSAAERTPLLAGWRDAVQRVRSH